MEIIKKVVGGWVLCMMLSFFAGAFTILFFMPKEITKENAAELCPYWMNKIEKSSRYTERK